MTDRTYRALLGLTLLIVLYFELEYVMYGIITLLLLEGLTDIRLPKLICMFRNCVAIHPQDYVNAELVMDSRFNIESERVWRIVVGLFLLVGYALIDALWFFPWFMGFAIFGAGLSGVCPVLIAIRWLGFK